MTRLFESAPLYPGRISVSRRHIDDAARTESGKRPPGGELHAVDERSRTINNLIYGPAAAWRTRRRLWANPETIVRVGPIVRDTALRRREVVRDVGDLHRRRRR